jgi:hypothetical protein
MNPIAEIAVRIVAGAVVLAGVSAPVAAGSAPAAQTMPDRSGPWAFNHPAETGGDGPTQMATTPAAEDANVWFLLVCDRSRLAAAVMDAAGFPYAVAPESAMVLRFGGHPHFTAEALSVSENQLSIGDAMARRLMPLVIESEWVVVTISDSGGGAHVYTFSLQPNRLALAGIVRGCRDGW